MFGYYKFRDLFNISEIRAHLCTVGVAMSFGSWWRAPRLAFRYGALGFALAHTAAALLVATPLALLQLAVGQLSQQDPVGMWRAVPFFRGIGYIKLLTTSLGSIYTVVYLALTVMNFLYTVSNPQTTWECTEIMSTEDLYDFVSYNSSILCLNETLLAPVGEHPEHYLAIAFIMTSFWIVFPFLLYNPIKLMKRIFYVFGPVLLVLVLVIAIYIGSWTDLRLMQNRSDWLNFLEPDIWHSAVVQALWSLQIAGGFLVSAGGTIYSSTDVQRTTLILVAVNIITSWLGIAFWFAIGGSGTKDTSAVAILLLIYQMAREKNLDNAWPVVIFATLFLSGVITMLTLLFPIYDRFLHIGGTRWRVISAASSLLGAGASLALLAGRPSALLLIEDIASPFLISISTLLEVLAFVFIYGWKVLVEDIEFLTGEKLSMVWVLGWCAAPGIILPFSVWWVIGTLGDDVSWISMSSETIALIVAFAVALVILVIFASVSVARQVQFDIIAKLKSSFEPSRRWGPRDPISHYYWQARRREADRPLGPRTRFRRRQLGQLSGFFAAPALRTAPHQCSACLKQRSCSDDWIYTVHRRQSLKTIYPEYLTKSKLRRSRSLDFDNVKNTKTKSGRVKFFSSENDFNR